MNKITEIIIVGLILFLGLGLRMHGLDKSPPSLGFDEAALGYNAYSLMKTGRDEYGNWMPISLRSFNDYKPALYAYLTIPFIRVMGLNDSAVRMVSVIAGTVSLLFLYLILKRYIKNKYWLWFGLLIISMQPWRLHFSRNAFETNLSMCWFTIGSWFLLKAKRKWDYVGAVLFFGLSIYSYHAARLSAPLLLLFVALDPLKIIKENHIKINWKLFLPLIGIILVCLPIFAANNSSLVLTRFNQENVFKKYFPYTPAELISSKNVWLNWQASPIYYLGGIIVGHIFAYVSGANLNFRLYPWIKQSPQFIPGMGMLGWIEGMVVLVGLVMVVGKLFKDNKYRFLIYWVVAGIAPAAATWTWFHDLRALNTIPALEILAILGMAQTGKYINLKFNNLQFKNFRWILGIGFTVIMMMSMVYTINNELLYSAYENNGEYQPGGFKEGMPYLKSIQDNYDQVVIDSPHAQSYIFVVFYEAYDPAKFQSYAYLRQKPNITGNQNFNFDKFVFRKVDWPKDQNLKKTVFWTNTGIEDKEVNAVIGAKIQRKIYNVLYPTADIITTE